VLDPALSEAARRAVDLAASSPEQARSLAQSTLAAARIQGDLGAESIAERALGLAEREEHRLDGAVDHLRRSVSAAGRAGLAREGAEARMSLALTWQLLGRGADARREIDRAADAARGLDLARVRAQRAWILATQGSTKEALDDYGRALVSLRRHRDLLWEARARNNRSLLYLEQEALSAAAADLVRAEELFRTLGNRRATAMVRHNLAMVVARQGDLPGALTWFERADELNRADGVFDPVGLHDRLEVLLNARLLIEAKQVAEQAESFFIRSGSAHYLADVRLARAELSLLDLDTAAARGLADQAARAFVRQHRRGWWEQARFVGIQAEWLGGPATPQLLAKARRAAAALGDAGWVVAAWEARLIAAQVAIALGRPETARAELDLARAARRRGPVEVRNLAWYAEALHRLAGGDRKGADRALRTGVDILARYRAALGATELRAHASGYAADLAGLGVRLAIEDGVPARVLAWAERWRAGSMWLRPMRPPDDRDLAAHLAELRHVSRQLEQAALAGDDTKRLLRRQVALETAVQRRARQVAPATMASPAVQAVKPSDLHQRLAGRALVEVIESDGTLRAVVVADGKLSLHLLGPSREAYAEVDSLRFALRRLAMGRGSPASLAAAAATAEHAARQLDRLLLSPTSSRIRDRPLVIVPTGGLHALPWPALPSCTERPIAVAPSTALWCRAEDGQRRRAAGRVVLVAGPGLPGAREEIDALKQQCYPRSVTLTGTEATAAAVARSLDGAGLAHVAAHGAFRADNPLLSSLRLADGPLTVYDLEALRHGPRRIVLSACDSGLSGIRPGDELMGLTAGLFSLGTLTMVATVVPVPDAATRPLMVDFHRHLQAGDSPAESLASVRIEARRGGDVADRAAAASFVCFGAG
jgi:CHAT domain-containing protein/tetratricopeptide (TPR) repeat protein